jgi:hypothetical protein
VSIKLYLYYITPTYKRATSAPIARDKISAISATGGTLDNKNLETAYPRMNKSNPTKMVIMVITSL